MAVPQYALTMGTKLGELAKWYGFAEKMSGEIDLCGGTAIAVPYNRLYRHAHQNAPRHSSTVTKISPMLRQNLHKCA